MRAWKRIAFRVTTSFLVARSLPIECLPQGPGQAEHGVSAFFGRSHDRASDDDTVRKLSDRSRLRRRRYPEAHTYRQGRRRAEARDRFRQRCRGVFLQASDPETTDKINEAAAVAGDL